LAAACGAGCGVAAAVPTVTGDDHAANADGAAVSPTATATSPMHAHLFGTSV
jgi:hypothetical protein